MEKINENHVKIVFIITITIFALILAIIQPINMGPDEKMKMDICTYIASHNSLPHGGDEAIRDQIWGISYGFTPILSYIVGGIFIKISNIFSQDIHIQYVSARLVSVICYSIMSIFIIKIAEKLFKNIYYKWLFIMLTTILPQVLFLGSYINNDSLALMSIAIIIYSWIKGLENEWNCKTCIMLSCGLGICALSYYNAYGYILTSALLFIADFIAEKKYAELIKKGLIITCITLTICGWWFVRSYIIYDGDVLGLKITDEYGEKYAQDEYKPSKRTTPANNNTSLLYMLIKQKWLSETAKSFIGVFGGMNIYLPKACYILYIIFFGTGYIGYSIRFYKNVKTDKKNRKDNLLEIIFILNIIIPIMLSIYYSYYSDFQPQGRYIMPMLIPFMYFVTCGIQEIIENRFKLNNKTKQKIQFAIFLLVILISINTLISITNKYC